MNTQGTMLFEFFNPQVFKFSIHNFSIFSLEWEQEGSKQLVFTPFYRFQ